MLNEKKQLRISVCKSNIKEKGMYYARVCKNGKISEKDLIMQVKQKFPALDVHNLEIALEVLSEVLVEKLEEGYDVELFGLGTVGLKGKGSIKVSEPLKRNLEGVFNKRDERSETTDEDIEGSYEKELSTITKKSVEFSVQFSPSRQVKKHIKEHVEPFYATIKMRKPKIESIEKVCSGGGVSGIIKVKGDDLKLVGDGMELYIKAKDKVVQIPKEAVLQNEPKTLMFLVNEPLKAGQVYSIGISTQYAKMGNRQTSVVRRCVKDFSFAKRNKNVG